MGRAASQITMQPALVSTNSVVMGRHGHVATNCKQSTIRSVSKHRNLCGSTGLTARLGHAFPVLVMASLLNTAWMANVESSITTLNVVGNGEIVVILQANVALERIFVVLGNAKMATAP